MCVYMQTCIIDTLFVKCASIKSHDYHMPVTPPTTTVQCSHERIIRGGHGEVGGQGLL